MIDKKTYRRAARTAREAIPEAERLAADQSIASRVLSSSEFMQAKALFTYLSVGTEVDTRAIIETALEAEKTVALPRVIPGTRKMTWHIITSLEGMEQSSFGIEEPPASYPQINPNASAQNSPTLALVPGLVFDRQGNRIGYGGGFYDTFLAQFPGSTIGLCRASALVEDLTTEIPLAPHDLPVDQIITD